jgi:hypothetical protein
MIVLKLSQNHLHSSSLLTIDHIVTSQISSRTTRNTHSKTKLQPVPGIIPSEKPRGIFDALIAYRTILANANGPQHQHQQQENTKNENIPEATPPGLSASNGAASPPTSKCSQILTLNSSKSSGDPRRKQGCREDHFTSFESSPPLKLPLLPL